MNTRSLRVYDEKNFEKLEQILLFMNNWCFFI